MTIVDEQMINETFSLILIFECLMKNLGILVEKKKVPSFEE